MSASSIPKTPQDPDFSSGLKWSTLGHGILFLAILIKGIAFPNKPLRYVPTLKVDLVGLPDVLKKDLNNSHTSKLHQEISQVLKKAEQEARRAKSRPQPKEMAKPEEMVIKPKTQSHSSEKSQEKTVEKRNKRALDRLKALSKIHDISDDSALPVKGNKVSPGSSLSGEAKESDQASYYDALQDLLKDNWTLPPWIARKNLTAQVKVKIDARGHLIDLKFTKSSDNPQFDEAVKRAIQESLPFPTPPTELENKLLHDGISLGFPL
jgi:colicin import membrane protein